MDDKSNVQFTVDKKNVRDDADKASDEAKQIGVKTREEARAITRKLDDFAHSKNSTLTLDRTSIELAPDSKLIVKVTRSGSNMKVLQLGLTPSSGSNLLASGGMFKEGETEAAITIEAPANAHNGAITITGNGESSVLNVTVEPALVPTSHEPNGAARAGEPR
jgi:hypothetical protein